MKGGWLRQDGQQTKPESAVFLAANQSPVLWRVAHKKQSGKRVTRYFPVCRGCRGKSTRGTRDCSRSTDERLNTTVWPNRPSGPRYIYGHMSTHVWREEDRDRASVCASFGDARRSFILKFLYTATEMLTILWVSFQFILLSMELCLDK